VGQKVKCHFGFGPQGSYAFIMILKHGVKHLKTDLPYFGIHVFYFFSARLHQSKWDRKAKDSD
jgi:hypothetical protein